MKRLILKEIKLVSMLEKKARKFQFHPKVTVIKGDNHTGKSSLIKSIYWTLGATPKNLHPNWEKADVISVLNFSIDNSNYSILRKKDFFAVFDEEDNVLETFDKITSGLGPFLADLLDYKIKLNSRSSQLITPPPAYYFLPFYIDQDVSWKENWSAFTNLAQLTNWRNNIISYHTGLKPNEYYEIKASIESEQREIGELDSKKNVSQGVLNKLLSQFENSIIDIDIVQFQKDIDELMEQYKILKNKGEATKENIVKLKSQKLQLQKQKDIVVTAIKELRADYEHALQQPDTINCPTCGQVHENSFAERFSIAQDEDNCKELLIQLKEDVKEIDQKIEKEYELYNENNKETQRIKAILERKQGSIKLKDVIQHEGKKELKAIVENEINDLNANINNLENSISIHKDDLKTYENRERQKQIKNDYLSLMRSYLLKLDVHTIGEESYKKITSNIRETGSGLPRALLAYYYSILHTMKKYSTATFCPIVIDSPNQQDQDEENLKKMMNLIFTEQPQDSQLVLGLVELGDYKFEGKVITLTNKYNLLQKKDYDKLSEYVKDLLEKSLEIN